MANGHMEAISIPLSRLFFGAIYLHMGCFPVFPRTFRWSEVEPSRNLNRNYRLRFEGVISEKGKFGYMGIFSRKMTILEVQEISKLYEWHLLFPWERW